MNSREMLLQEFHRLAEVPDAVPRLRRFVLDLAVRGMLVEQDADDKSASRALSAARRYLEDLAGRTRRLRWRASEPIKSSEAVGDLPRGWTHARLNDTGLYINGLAFKPSDWGTEGLPIIRIQNLTDPAKPMSRAKGEFPDEVLVRPGDILVSWSATLEAFRWERELGVLNQHIFRVLPAPDFVTPGFLLLLLRHAIRVMAEGIHAHGLVMTHINRGPFLAHVVAVPPLAEQHRIVAKVDELMALCDRLEAAQKLRQGDRLRLATASLNLVAKAPSPKVSALLLSEFHRLAAVPDAIPRLRRLVLDLAVRGRLVEQDPKDETAHVLLGEMAKRRAADGPKNRRRREVAAKPGESGEGKDALFVLPRNWAWCRVNDVGAVVGGGTPPSGDDENFTDGGSGTGWLTPADLGEPWSGQVRHGARDLTAKGLDCSSATIMPPGTVLFTSRAPIGYVAIAACEISTNQGFKSVVPFVGETSEYIALYFRAFGPWIDARAPGTTFREVSGKIVAALPFPLPPLAEQHRIVAKVDELMALCDRLEQLLTTGESQGGRLLEAVIQEALAEAS